ncbi:MAG: hypothetical protein KJZ69_04205 [Phycisphaerales bacterium]|nr:hypothetical protein [Phycisphaerales bacterium]
MRWPGLDLRPIAAGDLDARDRRLAQAIYGQVIRRWLTLEHLLNTRLERPLRELEAKMQAVLLAGAAQVFLFDQLPDHAIVNESVDWTKRRIRARAGGMVNAVLRRMIDLRGEVVPARPEGGAAQALPLSDGRWRLLNEAVLPDEPVERLAVQTGHPADLLRRWGRRMAPAEVVRLAMHNLIQPPTLLAGLSADFISQHDALEPHEEPGFAAWRGEPDQLAGFLRSHPQARVQDPASFGVVRFVREHGEVKGLIVDACAGSGTKTAQLAEAFPRATIVASDRDARRSAMLRERFADCPQVRVAPHSNLLEWAGRAELILLDVPCTNTGTLARRVEAKYRVDEEHVRSLLSLQKQIVADHLALRAPDGLIAYSTCSLEPEENHEQAAWICQWHAMRIVAERSRRPSGQPGDPPGRYSDGGYVALIR